MTSRASSGSETAAPRHAERRASESPPSARAQPPQRSPGQRPALSPSRPVRPPAPGSGAARGSGPATIPQKAAPRRLPPSGGRCGGPPQSAAALPPPPPAGSACDREAQAYVNWRAANPDFAPELVREAVARGDWLLRVAGSAEVAARALKEAKGAHQGNPFAGFMDAEVQAALDPDHTAYLREWPRMAPRPGAGPQGRG